MQNWVIIYILQFIKSQTSLDQFRPGRTKVDGKTRGGLSNNLSHNHIVGTAFLTLFKSEQIN